MDPNATLAEIRALVAACQAGDIIDGDRLAELFADLDDWLRSGGFLPAAWSRKR